MRLDRKVAIARTLAAAVIVLAFESAGAAQPASRSACPPVVGEREGMLEVLHSTGFNSQMARRCGIAETDIQRRMSSDVARLKPCLVERNILGPEIDATIAAGSRDGNVFYERSENKAAQCESKREEYAP